MGNSLNVSGRAPIHVFTSARSWVEGNALEQLQQVAELPHVEAVAGMPDLHPGKYGPVGCSILSPAIHPELVGSDIGCGMGLFQLDVAARKLKLDRLAERLRALDRPWDGDAAASLSEAGLAADGFATALGSIGGGNHFCEVQAIDAITDADAAARAGIDRDAAFVLVHSGSRGLGFAILERHLAAGGGVLDPAGEAGRAYLAAHDHAVRWAQLNRRIIARRAAEAAHTGMLPIADLSHNLAEVRTMEAAQPLVLHRKGAAPADRGLVPVPGSRGALSYLVEPLLAASPDALASLAHGAGRKYDRASMHGRVRTKRSDLERLARNPFGGLVVCEDRDLIVEEAPEAYKSIERVIDDLVDHGLARVVATFRPLVTFKTAANRQQRSRERQRDKREREDRR